MKFLPIRIIAAFFLAFSPWLSESSSTFAKQQRLAIETNPSAAMTTISLDTEGQNTCVAIDGTLMCWGHNDFDTTNPPAEYRMPDIISGFNGPVTQFALGDQHRCVVVNGGAWCWGFNVYGQVGDGTVSDSISPRQVVGLSTGVKEMALGMYHTCALKVNGTVYCWGFNRAGQLGNGEMDPPTGPPNWTIYTHPIPVQVINLGGPASHIFAGGQFSCAIVYEALKCWGANEQGQLGDNTTQNRAVPGSVLGLTSGISDVGMGYFHACAVVNGGLKCWGNGGGVIGDGTYEMRLTPVAIPGLGSNVSDVDSFNVHTCAVQGGKVFCWGSNSYGKLGDGTLTDRNSPVEVLEMTGAVSVAVGMDHSCAIVGFQVYCWGSNLNNQLGDGTIFIQKSPSLIDLPTPVTFVHGSLSSGCAAANGAMYCWGTGNGANKSPTITPGFESGVTQVSTDPRCALQNGAVRCDTSVIAGLESNATALAGGGYGHACAVVNGAARCFGINMRGQLGDGTTNYSAASVQVIGLTSGVTKVAARFFSSCAAKDGEVYCWGDGVSTPSKIPGISGSIDALSTNCAVVSGALKCWTFSDTGITPAVTVTGMDSGVTAVAGIDPTCAVQNGAAKCWGSNRLGQVGDGTLIDRTAPTQVLGLSSGVTGVGMGFHHSCAIQAGQLYCWGYNRYAQIGDNNPTYRTRPIKVIGLNQVPEIVINYTIGQPTSIFHILGSRFPANVHVHLMVNGVFLGETQTDNEGVFTVMVNTGSSGQGLYVVMAQVIGTADALPTGVGEVNQVAVQSISAMKIDDAAPLRLREGTAQSLSIPVTIQPLDKLLFIPILQK